MGLQLFRKAKGWAAATGRNIVSWLGIPLDSGGHGEKILSALGGFAGMLALALTARELGDPAALLLMGSIGASAVLIFAVPHSALAQPWSTVAGHIVSALIGVGAAKLTTDPLLAGATAVGGAILAMHYLRCIHPPGGGTALSAAIGGEGIKALGYSYAIAPVAVDAIGIVSVAVALNAFFPWRRYPAHFLHHSERPKGGAGESAFSHEDLSYALRKMGSFVDVVEDDLLRLFELANQHAEESRLAASEIRLGRYYSNGRYGPDWAVRQIVGLADNVMPDRPGMVYRVVSGRGRGTEGHCTPGEFARWACYEVVRSESYWRKVSPARRRRRGERYAPATSA